MTDYNKGQIYKVVDIGQTKCYIGSTVQRLSSRMAEHRASYKQYKEGKINYYNSVFNLFDEFGIENCKIMWMKDYPCSSKKELEAEEGRIQQETDCVNKKIQGRTQQDRYYLNLEHNREYQARWKREDRKNNSEKNKEKDRQRHYSRNATPFQCECGKVCLETSKYRHLNSKKHQEYLNSN